MSLIKSDAEIELERAVKNIKTRFKAHLDGYMANVLADLKANIESLNEDYRSETNDDIIIPSGELERMFLTGKHAFKDSLDAFWDHEGGSPYDKYETLDYDLDELEEKLDGHMRSDHSEEAETIHDDLKHMAEQYHLTDSQYWQDELKKILETEYNLVLITAPANNP